MLRSLYICAVYVAFIVLGVAAPFVFSLGYVWVDTFTPQYIATALASFPVSLVIAIFAIGGYFMLDRRSPPAVNPVLILTLLLAFWVTLSTFLWAVVPGEAFSKWTVAVKTLMFSAFLPYVFRSRVQIEAFIQIYIMSLIVYFLPEGIKTIISGGGYGAVLGIVSVNSGLAEGSTLSAVSLMLVPLLFFLRAHTVIMPKTRILALLYFGLAIGATAAAVGTYERTAIVGLAVLGCGLWLGTRRKILFGILGALAVWGGVTMSSHSWDKRIETIGDYNQESSALGRILVWRWTLDFVATHPFGGGFDSYMVDEISFPSADGGPPTVVHGKAFHSVYFEILGEQGWVGLVLFGGLIAAAAWNMRRVARQSRGVAELAWCKSLAFSLGISLAILLSCGAFIGIASQPMLYYLFAISAALRHHVARVTSANAELKEQRPLRAAGIARASRPQLPVPPERQRPGRARAG